MTSGIAALLLVRLDGAELHTRLTRRVGRGDAIVDEVLRPLLDVSAELVTQVAFESAPRDHGVDQMTKAPQHP